MYQRNKRIYSRKNPMIRKSKAFGRQWNRYTIPLYKSSIPYLKSALGLNTEKKYFDQVANAPSAGAVFTVTDLTPVTQGVAKNQRIGDKIKTVSSYTKMELRHNPLGVPTQSVRVLLVRALTSSQAPTEVLDTAGAGTNLLYPRNLDFSDKYEVVWDDVIQVSVGGLEIRTNKHYRKLNNKISYINNSALAERNSLFIMFASDQSTNGPQFVVHHRLRYVDN